MRVVLLGCGAINSRVAELLRSRQSSAVVVGVAVRRADAFLRERVPGAAVITEHAQLAALAPDIVIEAASREAVREWGPSALRAARRMIISSASAFADDDLLRDLKSVARQCGSQLVLSPGALAGVDAISAAARLGLHEVRHRIIKSPQSWARALGQSATSVEDAAPVVLFEGSAREAAQRYPLNANVTIVSALASVGLDRARVELIADPAVCANCHEIHASGERVGVGQDRQPSIAVQSEIIGACGARACSAGGKRSAGARPMKGRARIAGILGRSPSRLEARVEIEPA